jgi:hypothetical protein
MKKINARGDSEFGLPVDGTSYSKRKSSAFAKYCLFILNKEGVSRSVVLTISTNGQNWRARKDSNL